MSNKKNKKSALGLILGAIAVIVVIVVIFGIAYLNGWDKNNPVARNWITGSDRKTEQVSKSNKKTGSIKAGSNELKDEFFKIEKFNSNKFGNLVPAELVGKPDNADTEAVSGTAKDMVVQTLTVAAHNPTTLIGVARGYLSRNVKIPEEMTVTVDGQEYLSMEARELWAECWASASKMLADKDTQVVNSIPVSGYTDGMDKNGNYVIDSQRRNFSTENGLRFKNAEGKTVYQDADCGNFIWETPIKGVPQKPLNPQSIPPTRTPQKPEPKPEPKPNPDPSPNPNPNPQPQPKPGQKQPSLEPTAKGEAGIGGGTGANTQGQAATDVAPSFKDSYQAPPKPSVQPSANSNAKPSSGISNATSGSFTDSNGTTTVGQNGSVKTPTQNYSPLAGNEVTPPPVENGNTTNSGVNNGSMDANSIPMD